MTTLHMDTEIVEDAANQMDRVNGDLYFKPNKIRSAANTLQNAWQGGNATYFASELRRAAQILGEESIHLQKLAKRLRSEVVEWEEADHLGVTAWREINEHRVHARDPEFTISEHFADAFHFAGTLKDDVDFGAKLAIIGGLTPGTHYLGEVIVHGGERLKDAAGLSKKLTHIKAGNIPTHMGKFSKIEALGVGLDFAEKGVRDWSKYDNINDRVAALSVDAGFSVTKGVLSHYAGYFASAGAVSLATWALGGAAVVTGPVAVGVAAVGILAWAGGSWIADKWLDAGYSWAESAGWKDKAVDYIVQATDFVDQTVLITAAKGVVNTVDNSFAFARQSISVLSA